jgi:cell division transport system permease protein
MKFLKALVSFLIPLFIVLITFTIYSSITNVVNDYKKTIINDYAIMVVSKLPINKDKIEVLNSMKVTNIKTLERDEIITTLKEKLSRKSLKLLKRKLPYFYKIYLEDYPTMVQLKAIKSELLSVGGIKRVETFSTDHSKIYSLLILCERVISITFLFILIFTLLVLSKQISLWFYEHSKRITIIEYHGGSILYSALPIIKIAILSTLISSIGSAILSFILKSNLNLILSDDILSMIPNMTNVGAGFFSIFFLAFSISIVSIAGVLIRHKLK